MSACGGCGNRGDVIKATLKRAQAQQAKQAAATIARRSTVVVQHMLRDARRLAAPRPGRK